MSGTEGRRVSLVLVDCNGVVLGETPEVDVSLPHWQEIIPITNAFPGVVVLRMLSASPSKSDKMGGSVTYLAQAPESYDTSRLKSYPYSLDDNPLRMPWARPRGPAKDLDWAKQFIDFQGLPIQHRTWNLSSIWSIPSRSGIAWLKCVPPFFEHEATVLDSLVNYPVPRLIASQGHRILLRSLPGHDGYRATQNEIRSSLRQLYEMQIGTLDSCRSLIQKGVPHRTLESLGIEFSRILSVNGVKDSKTMTFLRTLPERIRSISAHQIPESIVHGDVHSGNFRIGISPPVIFDWGDSFIGHPFLDMGWMEDSETLQFWLKCWQSYCPEADVEYVWKQIRPIARLRSALVYEQFCANIEETEHIYHSRDITDAISKYLT